MGPAAATIGDASRFAVGGGGAFSGVVDSGVRLPFDETRLSTSVRRTGARCGRRCRGCRPPAPPRFGEDDQHRR